MYQSDHLNISFVAIVLLLIAIVISLAALYFIIKSAVKSAVNEELSRTNALIEWYLAKKYPEVKNVRGKSKMFAQSSKEKEENYTMLQTGARKEETYNKIKDQIEREMEHYLK